jgi:CheY-like chemotaxis protein/nitrogen-specific signal transduction histidine kinase
MGRSTPKRKAARRVAKSAPARKRASTSPRAIEAALASLAHDIRTPLTGILALADLLVAAELPERERGWARTIRSAADHLTQLTSLVLDAVKADRAGLTLRKDAFAPRALAEAIAAQLAARADASGLTADIAVADDLPARVIGDPVRLRAALENLIDNALKFTARGRVGFAVRAQPVSRGRMRLRLDVSDSGIGLTKAEIVKLFRPFAQASREVSQRFGGTGLGLSLVKRLAKAMGGDLTVASKKGEGSTFTLTVTVDAVPERVVRNASRKTASPEKNKSLRILCAEDNPFGRMVLNAMLTELGHHVDFARTGEAVVKAAARGGYDLILMDVTLPEVDGLAATRRIRALKGKAARIPIIGISGRPSDEDKRKARGAGMTDYLVKPVTPAALVEVLRRLGSAQH